MAQLSCQNRRSSRRETTSQRTTCGMMHRMGKHKKRRKQSQNEEQHVHANPQQVVTHPSHSMLKEAWVWSVFFFLISLGFPIVFPNADSAPLVYFGWTLWGLTLALFLLGFWLQVVGKRWAKGALAFVAAFAFLWAAHRNIVQRLRPSFVFVAPGAVLNGDSGTSLPIIAARNPVPTCRFYS